MTMLQTKSTRAFELKELSETGKFEGFVSVYGNVDYGDDVVEKGAFNKIRLTKNGKLRMYLYHDTQLPVGTSEVKDTDQGLFLNGSLNMNLKDAPQAYELMKEGMVSEMSVGFSIQKGGYEIKENDDGKSIRHITKAELYEGSLVPFAMNPEAVITGVKSQDEANLKRNLEKYYRAQGCSKRDATARASMCFDMSDDGDHRIDASAMLDSYKTLSTLIKTARI